MSSRLSQGRTLNTSALAKPRRVNARGASVYR
jgi:hypothetical protein